MEGEQQVATPATPRRGGRAAMQSRLRTPRKIAKTLKRHLNEKKQNENKEKKLKNNTGGAAGVSKAFKEAACCASLGPPASTGAEARVVLLKYLAILRASVRSMIGMLGNIPRLHPTRMRDGLIAVQKIGPWIKDATPCQCRGSVTISMGGTFMEWDVTASQLLASSPTYVNTAPLEGAHKDPNDQIKTKLPLITTLLSKFDLLFCSNTMMRLYSHI